MERESEGAEQSVDTKTGAGSEGPESAEASQEESSGDVILAPIYVEPCICRRSPCKSDSAVHRHHPFNGSASLREPVGGGGEQQRREHKCKHACIRL